VSMSDELKERNILKLVLIVRFPCATLDVGHSIYRYGKLKFTENLSTAENSVHKRFNSNDRGSAGERGRDVKVPFCFDPAERRNLSNINCMK
jgi:hypothetical protein